MEGHTMAIDGHVFKICFQNFDEIKYFAIRSKVKPRTKHRDPVTKLAYYNAWKRGKFFLRIVLVTECNTGILYHSKVMYLCDFICIIYPYVTHNNI